MKQMLKADRAHYKTNIFCIGNQNCNHLIPFIKMNLNTGCLQTEKENLTIMKNVETTRLLYRNFRQTRFVFVQFIIGMALSEILEVHCNSISYIK